jgi:serpin B
VVLQLSNLLQAVSSKDGNVFISPVSAEIVLALAYMGAAGSTAEQIASTLHLPPDRDEVKTGFAALLGSLKVRLRSTSGLTQGKASQHFWAHSR